MRKGEKNSFEELKDFFMGKNSCQNFLSNYNCIILTPIPLTHIYYNLLRKEHSFVSAQPICWSQPCQIS